MDNPLAQPAPENVFDRGHAFARDLAYGVAIGLWDARIGASFFHNDTEWYVDLKPNEDDRDPFAELLETKWNNRPPTHTLLVSLDYLELFKRHETTDSYILTEKAFRLLERPTAPPSVFISYRRSESSAFALLIEARLKLAGNPNPFVDKHLVVGEGWQAQLAETIAKSRYFVCLIGATTLSSAYVLDELRLAETSNCTIISIWHGCDIDDFPDCPPILRERHAIKVTGESALEYEVAVNQLLNGLGYSTY